MTATMPRPEPPSLRTLPSLAAGIQAGDEDEDRWHEFFRFYGPVIRGFALKAGLTETEADEVVLETCIGVARNVADNLRPPSVGAGSEFRSSTAFSETARHRSTI